MIVSELKSLSVPDLTRILEAAAVRRGSDKGPDGVSCDTRSLSAGELFFAVRGERFNGHDFVTDAFRKKAWGAVISEKRTEFSDLEDFTLLQTDDTVKALGKLAGYVRQSRTSMTVIGLTGSNGKTTTKELLRKALSTKGKAAASPGNFNNFIGVPLSIFGTCPDTRFAIIEMGTESPGEIAYLAGLAEPDVALVTNTGDTHLKHLNTREGVAREKAHIYTHMAEGGTGVVNADDRYADLFMSHISGPVVTFGMEHKADLCGKVARHDEDGFTLEVNGRWNISCPLHGIHNSMNLLAALGVCRSLGFGPEEFSDAFRDISMPPMRMERTIIQGIICYNDAYNANPQSVRAGISFITGMPIQNGNKKILVLGDMRDLGPSSDTLHTETGGLITGETADVLITVGEHAYHAGKSAAAGSNPPGRIIHCSTVTEAGEALFSVAEPGDILYVKGSRSVGLERILEER